jgi:Rod binding domain-containing protein
MTDLSITSSGRLPGVGGDPQERLKRAATQFEQVFVGMLLKREPLDDHPMIDGDSASQQFRDLRDMALSEKAAGSLGIAALLERELAVGKGGHKGEAKELPKNGTASALHPSSQPTVPPVSSS